MATEEAGEAGKLEQTDLSQRPAAAMTAAERAELTRRYERFVGHFRAQKLASAPSSGLARRIAKWRP